MIKRLKNINAKAVTHKTLIQNFSYLSALQIFNLVLPLITYPYLIRVLGKETYGLIVFAQAVIGYLLIFVGYGFNISATKEISIHRDNKEKLSEIISSVLIIKGAFLVLSMGILVLALWFIPQAKGYHALFYLTMWMCIYDVLFPIWYFQGIEKMKYITYLTLISRLFFLAMIFLLIKSPDDYLRMPIINGIGALLAGVASLYIIFGSHKIKFKTQTLATLKHYFFESTPLFLSNLSVKLYVSTNKVILGAFLGMAEVAYYDLGEKVTSILKIPQSILSQTLFPKINKDKNVNFIKKAFKYSILLNIAILIFTLAFSKIIVTVLGGPEMLPAIWILNILVLSVPVIAMSNIFGIQILIPFGQTRLFSKIIISSGLVYLLQILLVWTLWEINIYSVSMVTVTTEFFVTAIMFHFCKKLKLW